MYFPLSTFYLHGVTILSFKKKILIPTVIFPFNTVIKIFFNFFYKVLFPPFPPFPISSFYTDISLKKFFRTLAGTLEVIFDFSADFSSVKPLLPPIPLQLHTPIAVT